MNEYTPLTPAPFPCRLSPPSRQGVPALGRPARINRRRPSSSLRLWIRSCHPKYLRFLMPLDDPGGLPEEDYWAVLTYLLVRNGVIQENVPVGPETAEQIVIKQ